MKGKIDNLFIYILEGARKGVKFSELYKSEKKKLFWEHFKTLTPILEKKR